MPYNHDVELRYWDRPSYDEFAQQGPFREHSQPVHRPLPNLDTYMPETYEAVPEDLRGSNPDA